MSSGENTIISINRKVVQTMKRGSSFALRLTLVLLVPVVVAVGATAYLASDLKSESKSRGTAPSGPKKLIYEPRQPVDTSGYALVVPAIKPWNADAPLDEIANSWRESGHKVIERIDSELARGPQIQGRTVTLNILKAILLNYEGEPQQAYEILEGLRPNLEGDVARRLFATIIYCQGVTALRRGENENCIMCRGESSCILPIASSAVHTNPIGSRTAIRHFKEYLGMFPDDLEIRWLLNIAHMTLGEYPDKVDPKYLISIDPFVKSEFDIGRFRDVAHTAKVNRLNQAGGAIMDDFDNDGRLDLVATTFDPTGSMAFYHNKGDGTFDDRTKSAGLEGQLGGLTCFQADYNNDGRLDIFIPRGAWLEIPMRPTLLRNDGDRFTDVTAEAKVMEALNSNSACWADYDNDGFIDLFVASERQLNRLYHNRRDGTFEEVSAEAGVSGEPRNFTKGSTWIDFDNDGFPDLFLNHLNRSAQLFRNGGDGKFTEVTVPMGIHGPSAGFSVWAFDFDNDGWLDIFANCYDRTLGDVVKGLTGQPHMRQISRLYRNVRGERFEDVTVPAGLTGVYASMGSNFGDLDNDGYLDFYLGTGEPSLATLIPNRMFKNVEGKRFAEITGSSGTGHLQKGHGVAIGDWDNDGDNDIFVEMGGAVDGDKYHNILFQNPGQKNHWLTLKLVGKESNRAAIGARIKIIASGERPMTVQRHISTGSSFGANPLRQTIGLAKAERIDSLEVFWPTSKCTQVFKNVGVNQSIEIVEFAKDYRRVDSPMNANAMKMPPVTAETR